MTSSRHRDANFIIPINGRGFFGDIRLEPLVPCPLPRAGDFHILRSVFLEYFLAFSESIWTSRQAYTPKRDLVDLIPNPAAGVRIVRNGASRLVTNGIGIVLRITAGLDAYLAIFF